ncbi:two-component response regulator ARR14-like [Cornus florida]|uniref:two-component response regulator ARR14-like n=1 Tax=Cornus florida TaxID=4283 RepID=UPI00289FC9C7|nr:two-component response regulator ARR14-like [Cornus florida]
MWEPASSSSWTFEGGSSGVVPMASYHNITKEIRVLLVDHDKHCLATIAQMLESCSYKVTAVEHAVAAFLMLTERKELFDLVLAEIHLPDIDGFALIHEAVKMEVPAILMSPDENAMMARMALENGACFFLKKPIHMEVLKNLWQHVMRDRIVNKFNRSGISKGSVIGDYNETETSYLKNKDELKKKVMSRKSTNRNEEGKSKTKIRAGKKPCTEWTDELHAKFMTAVNELGEGRCYPKEILHLMNVPGLTRMQVASHLQKCRNDNWRAPEARKPASSSNDLDNDPQSNLAPRRFGSMPRVIKCSSSSQSHLQESSENYSGPEMYSPLCNNFSGTMNEEDPTQLINPQTEVVPECFGNNMVSPNYSGMQSMEQEGEFGRLADHLPTKDYTQNALEVPASLDDVNEISSENGHAKLAFLSNMTSQQNPEQIFSEANHATLGPGSHTTAPNQNQFSDDFFDFLPEMNDPQNCSHLLEDYNQSSQQYSFDFNQFY